MKATTAIAAALLTVSPALAVPAHAFEGNTAQWAGTTGLNGSASTTTTGGLGIKVGVAAAASLETLNTKYTDLGGSAEIFSPQISPTMPMVRIMQNANGSGNPQGTLNITFSRPVRDPVLHFTEIGGAAGGSNPATWQMYWTNLTVKSEPAGAVLLPPTTAYKSLAVTDGKTIRIAAKKQGRLGCLSTSGCGSIRVRGTVKSLSFAMQEDGYPNVNDTKADHFDLGITVDEDCSNSAESYGPAANVRGDLALGASVPAYQGGLVTGACSDPADVSDAAPKLTGLVSDMIGDWYKVTVPVSDGNGGGAGSPGTVTGWIDFNGDGKYSPNEKATAPVAAGARTAELSFAVPTSIKHGPTWARFRIAGAEVQPTGTADTGETEDYQLTIDKDICAC